MIINPDFRKWVKITLRNYGGSLWLEYLDGFGNNGEVTFESRHSIQEGRFSTPVDDTINAWLMAALDASPREDYDWLNQARLVIVIDPEPFLVERLVQMKPKTEWSDHSHTA